MRAGNDTGSLNAPVPALASPLPSVTEPFHSTSTCRSKVAIAPLFLICGGAPPPPPVAARFSPAAGIRSTVHSVSALLRPRHPSPLPFPPPRGIPPPSPHSAPLLRPPPRRRSPFPPSPVS